MSLPTTVSGVIERMRELDAGLDPADGVAVFNRIYLTVTERIETILAAPGRATVRFADAGTMAELDVRFANLWLTACEAAAGSGRVPDAWRPLFEARDGGRWPIQYAVAGMNSHIEHDLAVAVVETCAARGLEPDAIRADYEAVNAVLAEIEAPIRRSFLTEAGRELDAWVGPVVHVVSAWKIDKARDLSWVTAQTIWSLRHSDLLRGRFLEGLADTVGMTSRALLVPTR